MIDNAEDTPFINCNTAINGNDIISRSVTKKSIISFEAVIAQWLERRTRD